MGRDVTGLCMDNTPSMMNVKSNGTNHGAALVSPKATPEKLETKDQESDDSTVNGRLPDETNHKQDVLGIKSTNHDPKEKIIRAETPKTSVKPASGSSDNSSEPLTPAVENEKQSFTDYTNGAETNDAGTKFSQDDGGTSTPKSTNKSQPRSPSMSAKQRYSKFYDDEDNWSLASSTATSVRTNKSRITVPVAPKFTVDDRLERRKEYYAKLDEKHKALLKERQEYEARIKEEEEAVIKQMRKNMVVKANPVPSFYREGPPPKPELKKLPVTRPKSPNLTRNSTRRKSCGDAVRASSDDKGLNGRSTRHSVGVFRGGKNSPVAPKGKDRTGPRKSNETTKVKNRPKESTEIPKAKELGDSNNAVES